MGLLRWGFFFLQLSNAPRLPGVGGGGVGVGVSNDKCITVVYNLPPKSGNVK